MGRAALTLFSSSSLINTIVSGPEKHIQVVSISYFVAVLCICIVVGHLLEKNRWVNESIIAILIVKKKQFFHNFLPIMLFGVVGVFISAAIISAAPMTVGYSFAASSRSNSDWWLFPKVGFTGLEPQDYFALGVIFSSTDTVCTLQVLHQDETPLLYSLVFGEGVVNDATSVVLFNAIQKLDVSHLNGWTAAHVLLDFLYLFSTSTVLGVVAGLLTAFAAKTLYFGRHSTEREIALMVLMAYLSYMLAELLNLSGILTVFFCGIVMSHYAWHNVSENSRIATRHTFASLSFIAETFIFIYVGMDALDIEKWKMTKPSFKTSIGIYCTILLLVLVGRAAFVFPLSALSNCMSVNAEGQSITVKHQIIIWWAGLMRGAVSIALAFHQFTSSGVTWSVVHATMITSTVIVVLFSTLVFGFFTKPLINCLLPHQARDNRHKSGLNSPKEDLALPLLNFEESATSNLDRAKTSLSLLLERPVRTIHFYWRKFDDSYMRPIFGGPR
ncbi:hypothetical protein AAC387_Pa02g0060 [Persea americana]